MSTMHETDAVLINALRRYISAAVHEHAEAEQFERAFQRRELTFHFEYESATQTVQVTGINRQGEALVISSRALGS